MLDHHIFHFVSLYLSYNFTFTEADQSWYLLHTVTHNVWICFTNKLQRFEAVLGSSVRVNPHSAMLSHTVLFCIGSQL
jgi:hypothetical protein